MRNTVVNELLSHQVDKAVSILKDGGVIAFPTDTVYGIGANVFHEEAVKKIYKIKERPRDKPIAVLVSSIDEVKNIATDIPQIFYDLASRHWPGALTMILRSRQIVSSAVIAGLSTVGVRMPNDQITLSLIRKLGNPIAATSANLSGKTPATSAEQVRQFLKGRVDFIIDGGDAELGVASTVVDLSTSPPAVLRQGTLKIDKKYTIQGESS